MKKQIKTIVLNTGEQDLSGTYKIMPDPDLRGKEENWQNTVQNGAVDTIIPGYLQETLGDIHGVVWYWKNFTVDNGVDPFAIYHIQFGFVDYYAEIWLNGIYLGSHEGADTNFEFDVSGSLIDGENLLSVYLINIASKEIQGLSFYQTAKSSKIDENVLPGTLYNNGGIVYPVCLKKTPQVFIKDVYIKPFWETGVLEVQITTKNTLNKRISGKLCLAIADGAQGSFIQISDSEVVFEIDTSTQVISAKINSPRLWSVENPNLYTLLTSLEIYNDNISIAHNTRTRFGFRHFEVKGGFFYLNGKRIFLKSSHTANCYPHGHSSIKDVDNMLFRDLYYAKAAGFNAIRFINGLPYPEQLDYCDEIGLMIYEQCTAGWSLGESPNMKRIFDSMTIEMIQRDRNHPCVTIWGLINETPNNELYKNARDFLANVRELDDTRLVLLASGRWDCEMQTGSVCNARSLTWEHQWGAEAEGTDLIGGPVGAGYAPRMGDIHMYPTMPQKPEFINEVRTVGNGTKPVFLSEYGVGSQFDIVRTLRLYEQDNLNPISPEYVFMKRVVEQYELNWKKYGLEGIYPFPEDMIIDSYRKQTCQRNHTFNIVRSNPNICGYNLTGLLDHGYTGEGLWSYFRELKPGIMETLRDGFSPLRWCMFTSNSNVYSGQSFTIEVVLANEDILPPGEYPVCIRISGNSEVVWEKKLTLDLPKIENDENPLTVQVIKEEITLDVAPGKYTLAANMLKGGAPAGGRLDFTISVPQPKFENTPIIVYGISSDTQKLLKKMGAVCNEYDGITNGLILVGPLENKTLEDWRTLAGLVANGSTVVFLSPSALARGDNASGWLPLKNKGYLYGFNDWLYHKETIIGRHDYFNGLDKGIADYDKYRFCYPSYIFTGQDIPDEVAAAGFAVTNYCTEGYEAGMELCVYKFGAGRFVFNAFRIIETLSDNPLANHLLHNIVKSEYEKLPVNYIENAVTEQMLIEINYIELPKADE